MFRRLSVAVVYRHVRSDAVAAANAQNWAECIRLMEIAREIERAYPTAAAKARFATRPEPAKID